MDWSTRMNKLQSGPPRHGQLLTMAEIKLRHFSNNNFKMRACARVAATGGTRRAHHFIHVKGILLLADSNHIAWAPSIPCCLLSRPPESRLGILHTLSSESKELRTLPSQSACALAWVTTIEAFFNGVSEAWSLCALALSHMKPRGSLTATVLTEGKTQPEGSADLECPHQANESSMLLSELRVIFSVKKCIWIK